MTPELWWAKSSVDPVTGCRNWNGSLTTHGYGQCAYTEILGPGKITRAHRVAWALAKNDGKLPPPGFSVHHLCENKRCVNPDHLELLEDKTHRHHHAGRGCHIHGYQDWKIRKPLPSGRKKGGYCRICDREYQRRYQREVYMPKKRATLASVRGNSDT